MKFNRGFSIAEILGAIAILVVISSISVSILVKISNSNSLDKEAQIILSLVTKARTEAINSVGSTQHGVKFSSTSVAIFSGTVYSPLNIESMYTPHYSTLSDISLSNGGTELYFNKLSGNASATGTVTISSGESSKAMIIYGTGLVEIQ